MVETELKKDYAYCEKVIKASSKSFYTAFSKLPKDKAKAVYAIYAFCRQADDTVDANEPLALKKENLAILEAELKEFEKGKTPNHPMWRALRDVFNRYAMTTSPFYDQLEGQKRDLDFQEITDLAALKDYSYYVAGSVGLMLLPILATKSGITESLKESAVSLGVAMQITNILRDVGEDYRENKRVYLPTELLDRHQVDLAQNVEKGPDNNFIALWEELAEESSRGYVEFEDSISHYDSDCRFPVLVSSKLYSGIMDSVRKNNYDCLSKRNYVPEARMMELILETRKILKKR
ncbi:phytoene/squalene synthase family protein [Jeotgalibaca porci]|uniref:Phytoene/squalene synthase family protein n=1 Tax=Jeotgalibaca porci TaxID=1868793 RepID=A0A6G7WH49_9LACT|nr:phytoene/squalene synthase family protein [Jeotgalibaca porci]QIK51549.1 phytoene/squalene synthase family protein [Jeotgalibaca porci]